jgi:hypothetical protein
MTKTTLTSDELDALATLMERKWFEVSAITGLNVSQCRTLLDKLIAMEVEVSND